MKVLDPGHKYQLATLDGDVNVELTFVKRNNPASYYPGNLDAYPGTTLQEVIRACLERARYVDRQSEIMGLSMPENQRLIHHLRQSLVELENRAARVHGRPQDITEDQAEFGPFCPQCGHAGCNEGE